MTNVSTLGAANNLTNIPHMLRNLAADIEAGAESARTVLVIGIIDGHTPPEIFHFGQELSRLEEAGALTAVIHTILQIGAP